MSANDRQVRQPLAVFYALFFALVGCNAPYWGPYLQSLGFDYGDIGSAIASFSLVRIVAPMLWAHWSRYFHTPLHMARIAGLMTAVCFSAIWLVDGFWPVLGVMLLYGFFWSAMLPQYEVITMHAIANRVEDYSRIRLWGSVGFVITVALLGWLFEYIPVDWLPAVMLVLMLGVVVNSWRLKPAADQQPGRDNGEDSSLWALLTRWPVMAFLLVNLLLQVSHGPLYTFLSIYLDDNGYSSSSIGLLWALGVVAEVILFWRIRWLLQWLNLRHWLLVSLLITALRWLLIAAFPQQLWVLLLAQASHAFTFAMLHAVCIRYVSVLFAASHGRGQALYSSAGFGLGGALGAWLSGYFWHLGGEWVFVGAAVVAVLALIVAWKGMNIKIE
ncbi:MULTISPECIES: MFS transporter [unclassified Oceanobacter]|uniref:MFS transporter n=1 Tax=unclassified Oceanobacter TaxID=2620260 RepID=UPI002732D773|nr:MULTISPECIES: MFS transporter [unclassified Oceanobacter]MDP2507029.1 MFS transporter [Oceanobacter sp. 3_MG-2023]MDP2548141.1 MFS transporter [Oceanobacter sp. 4_MG-2023]